MSIFILLLMKHPGYGQSKMPIVVAEGYHVNSFRQTVGSCHVFGIETHTDHFLHKNFQG